MNGRLQHYLEKAKVRVRKDGVFALMGEGFSFLIRRKFFLQLLFESLEYHFFSKFRNIPATVKQVVKNDVIISQRILIYASFDQKSEIGDHVVRQLKAFQNEGYQNVFVTTSPELPVKEYEKIRDLVSILVCRKNEGYDFVSYKVGFDLIKTRITSLESLVVMNDSCMGPEFDFGSILQKMRDAKTSVYGISKSLEITEHIQSYFYHFGSRVLTESVTKQFFERIRILRSKWGIVRYFEIGNSRMLTEASVKLEALIDPNDALILKKMQISGLTEPTREPLASEWVKLKMNPFYKRSSRET